MKDFKKLLTHPNWSFSSWYQRHNFQTMPDEEYIRKVYFINFLKRINLKNPSTFNEKLNWMKLNRREDIYTQMADKYAVKEIVTSLIGSQYVVKNYGVYDSWDDIDFSKLPDQFVLKGTHDSGGASLCRDKKTFNYNAVRTKIEKNQKINFFYWYREWPYLNIKPRIIADELLDDHTGNELRDYKFWCFNGKPTYMYITIKGKNVYENFYDMDYNPVGINHLFPRHIPEFDKPANFELMKDLAAKLSKGIPFVRVDFFDVNGRVYFGEYTFYDWGGMRPFKGDWDEKLGKLIEL